MLPLLIQQTRVHPIFKIEYKHFLSDLMKDFEEAHMVNGKRMEVINVEEFDKAITIQNTKTEKQISGQGDELSITKPELQPLNKR
ncbi:copper-transporting ATPase 1 [Vespula maculifrons]|uniref:Copper-transporting ATPase 1 n=1 Tax=Vespula maculifrons TaxID=7453 RepID=A0ABD2C9N3_VESMC